MTDHPETTEPTRKRMRLNLKRLASGQWQPDQTVEIDTTDSNEAMEACFADLLIRLERQTANAIARREGDA